MTAPAREDPARSTVPALRGRRSVLAWLGLGALGLPVKAGVMDWFNGARVGQPLPAYEADIVAGERPRPGDVVLVDFWATWCAPCRAQIPALNALHEKYRSRGFSVLGLTMESADIVRPFLAKVAMRYPVGTGDARPLQKALGIRALPYGVLVDRRGKIAWRGEPGELEEGIIAKLVAGPADRA